MSAAAPGSLMPSQNLLRSGLRGLALGLAGGFIAIVCVPLIYFAIGWVLGSLQGVIINALVSISGGIVVETQKEEE